MSERESERVCRRKIERESGRERARERERERERKREMNGRTKKKRQEITLFLPGLIISNRPHTQSLIFYWTKTL